MWKQAEDVGSIPITRSKKCALPIQCSAHGLDKSIAYCRIGVRYDVQFKGVLQMPHSSSWPRTSDSQSEDQQFESAMRYNSFPTDAATTSTGKTRIHWQMLLWDRVGFGKCRGGVMVASPHSKCGPIDGVRVRVPPSAQKSKKIYRPSDSHRLQVKVILPVSTVVPRSFLWKEPTTERKG